MRGGVRTIFANDPWSGLKTYTIANSSVADPADPGWYMWPTSGPLLGRKQELSVSDDSDDDGVKDFDETERFQTDPNEVDTTTTASTTSRTSCPPSSTPPTDTPSPSTRTRRSREWTAATSTGMACPTERDPDSDNGDCKDGDEDKNLDGMRDPGETWNFLAGDDPCGPLSGGLQWTSSYAVGGDESWQRVVESFSLSARLKAGSRRSDAGVPRRRFDLLVRDSNEQLHAGHRGCDDHSDSQGTKSGRFAPGDFKAAIVPEYENGKDGLGLGISCRSTTRGRHWNCLIDEQITGTAYFGADDFCWGLEDGDDGIPAHTFVFTCGDSIGAGWFGRTWTLSGTIVIR